MRFWLISVSEYLEPAQLRKEKNIGEDAIFDVSSD